jgi:hypothetical protein
MSILERHYLANNLLTEGIFPRLYFAPKIYGVQVWVGLRQDVGFGGIRPEANDDGDALAGVIALVSPARPGPTSATMVLFVNAD